MKTRLFLSVATMNRTPDEICHQIANINATFDLVSNVYPMYSSVYAKRAKLTRAEPAARIDILSDIEPNRVLLLWERLRQVLGIHCVWLDFRQTSDGYEYSGCVCEWEYYKAHFDHIGHDEALGCSEY
jgi:hypothetical protein